MYTFQRLLTLTLLFALVVLFSCVSTEDTSTEDTSTEDTSTEDTSTEDTSTEDVLIEDALIEDTLIEDTLTEDVLIEDALTDDTLIEETPIKFAGYLKEVDGSLWLYVVPEGTNTLLIPHPFNDFEGGVITGTKTNINKLILDLYEFVYPGKRISVLIDSDEVINSNVVPESKRTTFNQLGYVFSESEGWTLPNNE